MKAGELRAMSIEELQEELQNSRKELYNLRHQQTVGQLENPAQFTKAKRTIARILTLLKEREMAAGAPQARGSDQ
ncbi:MAG: 50S ribosomal protein L29 [Planctomycetes bacterium]|nr:50S ribosomal protein L29 [Planctomycetota bacterium]